MNIKQLAPYQWALVFLLPYRKEAERRGVKLARRHLEKLKNGFCREYACKRRGLTGVNGLYWWHYADNVAMLTGQKPALRISKMIR